MDGVQGVQAHPAWRVVDARSTGRRTRRRALLGGAGLAAVVATACGPGGPGPDGAPPAAGGMQPVKLLWQIRDGPTYEELAKWGIGQYTQKHPQVSVDTTLDAGNVEKTVTLMAAGQGPDVIHGWGFVMWQYAGKGQLYNHSELIRDWKKADVDDFADFQWKGFLIPTTGFRFGVPTYINMMVLYYNRTLFQKRGQKEPTADWTHDDYTQMLRQLTFQDGDKKVWGGISPPTPSTGSRTTSSCTGATSSTRRTWPRRCWISRGPRPAWTGCTSASGRTRRSPRARTSSRRGSR